MARQRTDLGSHTDHLLDDGGTRSPMNPSHIGIRTLVEHVRDDKTGDKAGYFGD